MHRRTVLLAGLAAGTSLVSSRVISARQATPIPDAGFPPLRWELQQIASNNRVLTPDDPAAYWLQLLDDGTAWIRADCNQGRGSYDRDGSSLTFTDFATTLVACPDGSIADDYQRSLGYVVSYLIVGDLNDELVLQMMADGGSLTFRPALTGVVWEWVQFEGGDGAVVSAADPGRYTVEFLDEGGIHVQADCNRGQGSASIDGSSLDLTVATTRMACPPDSQASDFLRYLDEAVTFVIQGGMLHLSLPVDSGIASFRPVVPDRGVATPVAGS